MSSDEDDDFVIYGEPLDEIDEDTLPRKKPIKVEDQVAKDEHGKRRFHGAFTGGYTAGFFNTVGSLEGWKPSNFLSSRSSKFEYKQQTPEDFMDDEDKGEFGISPMAIKVKSTFDNSVEENDGKRRRNEIRNSDTSISGILNVKDILQPIKETIGIKLLIKMGWRPGQGVGPRLTAQEKLMKKDSLKKTYGCFLPNRQQNQLINEDESTEDANDLTGITFAPDEYLTYAPKPKENTFGLGYSGMSRDPVLSFQKESYSKLTVQGKSIRGQAFGVGAYEEEDEDIYAADDMSQYDFSLGLTSKNSRTKNKDQRNNEYDREVLEGFCLASQQICSKEIFPLIKVPSDFIPYHKFKTSRFNNSANSKRLQKQTSNVQERSLVLSDIGSNLEQKQSGNSGLNVCTDNSVLLSKSDYKNTQSSDSTTELSNRFKPFSSDPEKQKRYEQFLGFVKTNKTELLASIQPKTMTDWERVREELEFEKAAKLFGSVSSELSNRFTGGKLLDDVSTVPEPLPENEEDSDTKARKDAAEKEMYGFLTRREYKFIPCKLLCKLFNVPEPQNRDDLEMCPDTVRKSKQQNKGIFSVLESVTLLANTLNDEKNIPVSELDESKNQSKDASDKSVEAINQLEDDDVILNTDNRNDLFKAIFLDSSGDEAEETTRNKLDNDETQSIIHANTAITELLTTGNDSISRPGDAVINKNEDQILYDPPTGIFANLDLDSLSTGKYEKKPNVNVVKHEKKPNVDVVKHDIDNCAHGTGINELADQIAKESYGPALPPTTSTVTYDSLKSSSITHNIKSGSSDDELWVEKEKHKSHKSKKKKYKSHKNKHKKHKR